MRNRYWISLFIVLGLTLVGCGTKAEVPNPTFVPTTTFDASSRVALSVSNKGEDGETTVVIEPTDTEMPTEAPTEIPTEVPTEMPTEIPTEVPTEAPTETPAPIGDAVNGQLVFLGVGGCSACHSIDAEMTLVGPSLMNVELVAGSRIPGYTAEQYLHESIVNPDALIVPGFQMGLMPKTFATTLTEQQINDLIAYLLKP